jgi:two-component system sensor histidine kinase UhpB
MRSKLSLRSRLNLLIGLTMALILVIGFLFAVHDARQSVRNEAESSVRLTLGLIETALVGESLHALSLSDWMERLAKLDKTRHLKITVGGDFPAAPLPTRRREAASPVPGWFRWAVAPEPVVVERRLNQPGKSPISIRIAANADDEIMEAWSETRGFLLLLIALAASIYALIHFTVGHAFGPVEIMLMGLEKIERGEFDDRLPSFSLPEMDRLSGGINHLAETLSKARSENVALTRHSLAIQEEERRILAQEVHDEFGQCLTAIKLLGASLRKPVESPTPAANQIIELCDRLFHVVKNMMRRLRPMSLEDLGLAAALQDLIEQWQSSHPEMEFNLECDPNIKQIRADVALQIFRLAQEGLTNMVRHANARQGWLSLQLPASRMIEMTMRDDGQGFDPRNHAKGFGLNGMRERVSSLGGRFALETRPGEGLILRILIPCSESGP